MMIAFNAVRSGTLVALLVAALILTACGQVDVPNADMSQPGVSEPGTSGPSTSKPNDSNSDVSARVPSPYGELSDNVVAEDGSGSFKISMRLDEPVEGYSPTSAKLIFDNQTGNYVGYGHAFEIEQLLKGDWYEVPYISDSWGFTEELMYVAPGIEEIPFEWLQIYGHLDEGHYRVVKSLIVKFQGEKEINHTLAAEFDID